MNPLDLNLHMIQLYSDMTVCVDVLEHIEPEKLDAVLDHIYQKTNKIILF